MNWNRDAVLAWTKRAADEELLDRATALRDELEPAAVDLLLAELADRGFSATDVANHGAARAAVWVRRPDGSVPRCWRCSAPATDRVRQWWKLFGLLPVVPVRRPVCPRHA
jgi:DNA-binding IclR family transcriptional regulator